MTELDDTLADRVGSTSPSDVRATPAETEEPSAPDAPVTPATTEPATVPPPAHAVPSARLTRRGRVRKWDRPPPPHDWRWWVGNTGKVLIAVGLLMFGFVAYQLWGTGIETARAQRALENDFEELLAAAPPIELDTADVIEIGDSPPTAASSGGDAPEVPPNVWPEELVEDETTEFEVALDPVGAEPAAAVEVVPVEAQNIPEVESGDALARIEIPEIGVDDIVVAGVATSDLKKGPGHFPDTPIPGQLGNSAIAGHRTTYGAPFHNVDDLEPGDEIVVTTLSGRFVYRVTGQEIVSPSAYEVVATTDPTKATLTLTSCHPKFSARERIVIFSELDSEASALVGEPVINYGRPLDEPLDGDDEPADEVADAPADGGADEEDPAVVADSSSSSGTATGTMVDEATVGIEALGTAQANQGIADAFAEGWFSDPSANPHVLFWGLLLALIGVGAYLISRKLRRDWVGALVMIVPFTVTLYFFFQNVNRLLPPNL